MRYGDCIAIDFFTGACHQEGLHEYGLLYTTVCSRRKLEIALLCKPAYRARSRRNNPSPVTKPRPVSVVIAGEASNDEIAELGGLYWYVLPEGARNTKVMAPIEEWEGPSGERIVASTRNTRPNAINDLISEVDEQDPAPTASEQAVMDPADFAAHEIEPYVYTTARLALFLAPGEEPFVMDLYLKPPHTGLPEHVVYGKGWNSKELIHSKLARALDRRSDGGMLTLRSALEERDAESGLPFEEVRAWSIHPYTDPEDWRMSPEAAQRRLIYHPQTGNALEPGATHIFP